MLLCLFTKLYKSHFSASSARSNYCVSKPLQCCSYINWRPLTFFFQQKCDSTGDAWSTANECCHRNYFWNSIWHDTFSSSIDIEMLVFLTRSKNAIFIPGLLYFKTKSNKYPVWNVILQILNTIEEYWNKSPDAFHKKNCNFKIYGQGFNRQIEECILFFQRCIILKSNFVISVSVIYT